MRQPVANVHRRDAVLLCTEVMAMGVHTPGLDIGVSLGWCGHGWSRDNAQPGVPSARWKVVQEAGRVGRDPSRHATFITVVEKKRLAKGHNL